MPLSIHRKAIYPASSVAPKAVKRRHRLALWPDPRGPVCPPSQLVSGMTNGETNVSRLHEKIGSQLHYSHFPM
jgi:hypothetical protein